MTNFRMALRKVSSPSTREWLNVFAALGALLVGIVSFWTTARISGLEDYLRSEIARRNTDLDVVAKRSAQLERIADARSDRLAQVQLSTDRLIATSLATQQDLLSAQSGLQKVQKDAVVAAGELASAQRALGVERRALDLVKRQRTAESLMSHIAFAGYNLDQKPDSGRPFGERILIAIQSANPPSTNPELIPYFQRVSKRIAAVCPALGLWDRPVVSSPGDKIPEAPPIRYSRGANRAAIQAAYKASNDQWSEDIKAFVAARDASNQSMNERSKQAVAFANQCACQALADGEISPRQVCPAQPLGTE